MSAKPTIRELLDMLGPDDTSMAEVLAERVEAVLKLHANSNLTPVGECLGCYLNWPCPTIRALDGER